MTESSNNNPLCNSYSNNLEDSEDSDSWDNSTKSTSSNDSDKTLYDENVNGSILNNSNYTDELENLGKKQQTEIETEKFNSIINQLEELMNENIISVTVNIGSDKNKTLSHFTFTSQHKIQASSQPIPPAEPLPPLPPLLPLPPAQDNYDIFPCPNCTEVFKDAISMNDHILIYHDNAFLDIFTCDRCSEEFYTHADLEKHYGLHRRIPKVNPLKSTKQTSGYSTSFLSGMGSSVPIKIGASKRQLPPVGENLLSDTDEEVSDDENEAQEPNKTDEIKTHRIKNGDDITILNDLVEYLNTEKNGSDEGDESDEEKNDSIMNDENNVVSLTDSVDGTKSKSKTRIDRSRPILMSRQDRINRQTSHIQRFIETYTTMMKDVIENESNGKRTKNNLKRNNINPSLLNSNTEINASVKSLEPVSSELTDFSEMYEDTIPKYSETDDNTDMDTDVDTDISDGTDDESPEYDNIQTNERGKFSCLVCGRKYLTEHLLGAHFTIAHSKYDEMLELDEKMNKDGFPGFNILREIDMIYLPNQNKINTMVNVNDCNICCEIYNETNIDKILDTNKHTRRGIIEITHRTRIPLFMSCCDKHICSTCLEETLKENQALKCPYCGHDHIQYDKDFICIYEFKKSHKKSWLDWWKKHTEIFYPILDSESDSKLNT
ncbi:MAG: procyclic acidic repetitive protein PARP [Terrestrivirus sp.]|uniref:Procyclic acidic repetitive protein PARP n=1 Tax=Terrestrivirus sp. TaxID=2487775 RepID=A0A3G4ZNB1_9VIRU|nr:MAG: procyclic acidic repetitive protein PARP [Terrestrivirus sp.]